MKIQGTGKDRKKLVEELEKATGLQKSYLGEPTFTYKVGEYAVLRDGSVEVPDEKADMDLIRSLTVKGFLEGEDEEAPSLSIDLPLEGKSSQGLMNLINMIHSRQCLLNQSVGRPGAFHIDEKARQKLEMELPTDAAGFAAKMTEIGKDKFKGILIDDRIHFTGFPLSDDPETTKAYTMLAALMGKKAEENQRVKAQAPESLNQKYSFRIWLIGLGMKGDEYKAARKVLLQNLSGNGAFRTPEQAETFKNRMKEKREKEKEKKCLEFTPL